MFLTLIWIYIDSSCEKIISFESGKRSAQIKNSLQAKAVLNKYVGEFEVRGQQRVDFFTGGSIIMDYGPIFCPEVTV